MKQSNPQRAMTWLLHGIEQLEAAILAGSILVIAALSCANVIGRLLFGYSLAFAEELSQFAILFVTFVGLGYAAAQGRHIRMSAITDQLPTRGRRLVMVLIAATTSLLLFTFAVFSIRYIGTVSTLGSVSPVLQVPMYLVYLVAPFGLVLSGVQYVLTAIANVRGDRVYIAMGREEALEEEPPSGLG